ncbi:hypothetical protein NPIL_376981 [Nephila pilipes]|uniref:Uncharacterized protein n=1 Tax=Nephila pilipes TaxID=299642 RepID=A0A8X6TF73_NEPPI|nr:hypothetical protein NPIL_376981 [Nephila pilipes]
MCKSTSAYKKQDRKIRANKFLIRARTHRSCATSTSIQVFSLLPHLRGLVFQMARCISMAEISAEVVAKAFYTGWVSRFGPPLKLTTEQGTHHLNLRPYRSS